MAYIKFETMTPMYIKGNKMCVEHCLKCNKDINIHRDNFNQTFWTLHVDGQEFKHVKLSSIKYITDAEKKRQDKEGA